MPLPLTSPGRWIRDSRGEGRAVRVSAHTEAGFLVLSTWKADLCVATVRLLPDEAAQLADSIADGLARLATAAVDAAQTAPSGAADQPEPGDLAALTARVGALEAG